MNDSNKSIR